MALLRKRSILDGYPPEHVENVRAPKRLRAGTSQVAADDSPSSAGDHLIHSLQPTWSQLREWLRGKCISLLLNKRPNASCCFSFCVLDRPVLHGMVRQFNPRLNAVQVHPREFRVDLVYNDDVVNPSTRVYMSPVEHPALLPPLYQTYFLVQDSASEIYGYFDTGVKITLNLVADYFCAKFITAYELQETVPSLPRELVSLIMSHV